MDYLVIQIDGHIYCPCTDFQYFSWMNICLKNVAWFSDTLNTYISGTIFEKHSETVPKLAHELVNGEVICQN